jgi:DNA-binding transcriptional LysR family regulator
MRVAAHAEKSRGSDALFVEWKQSMLDLSDLRVFVKVAELASFTRAAEQLHMSKARASKHVGALEAELGVRLLQRTTRTVRPTADGEQLLPKAKQLLADADEIGTSLAGPRNLRGVVRVDAPIVFAREVIIPKLPELLAAHPQLEIQLSSTDRRVDVVREGFDCVLSIGTLAPSELIVQRLGELAMVNCASPAYLARHGTPAAPDDLDSHLVVHYSMRFGSDAPDFEHRAGGGWAHRPMRSAITVNSADAFRAACLAGLGIIQTPRLGVGALLARGALVEILPDHTCAPMPVQLVHAHGRQVPARVRVVLTWLAAIMRQALAR